MNKNAFMNFLNDYKIFLNDVKKEKNKTNKIKKIIPNILTASRILSPLFIIPTFLTGNIPLTVSFIALFATTDLFDGLLARKFNSTSEFGKNLDPICDKVFAMSVIIPLITNKLLILSFMLEGIISIINLTSAFKGNNPRSTLLGKFKTCMLSISIILSYMTCFNITFKYINEFILLTSTVQFLAACDYLKIDLKKDIKKNIKKDIKINENNTSIENNYDYTKINDIKKDIINYKAFKDELINQYEPLKTDKEISKKY